MNIDPANVSGTNAKIFMRFLAKDCKYGKNSLKRVIGPHLKKENLLIGEDLRQVYREISKISDTEKIRRPCIADDVRHIISSTPDYI